MQAQRIAENALSVFEKLEQLRPTKSSTFGFIVGRLMSKSACVEAELALTSQDRDEKLLAACQVHKRCIRLHLMKSFISLHCTGERPKKVVVDNGNLLT